MPLTALLILVALAGVLPAQADSETGRIDFNRDIRPILSGKCFHCHGPDPSERKGGIDGLRLDTAEGATMDLGGYAAIVPGEPEKSELYRRVTAADREDQMPPPDTGKQLSATERDKLRQWIAEGAPYARHWSYVPPVRPDLPDVKDGQWPKTAIDYFILSRLEQRGFEPQPEADREVLIRRVSLDLTGLPPALDEVDHFVNDGGPHAYERLVERLLNKKAFGEHWARFWLDHARYADSAGYADDPARTIWAFRDYVIRALNQNKPFDRFTIEQIAGDLLEEPSEDQLIATAFHRNTQTNNEGGTSDEEFRNVAVVDRVNTTMQVWMGTTMACAQCHTHKYDPISQEEYFQLFAILNNTADADRKDESPVLEIHTDAQEKRMEQLDAEIASLKRVLNTPTPELENAQTEWEKTFEAELAWTPLHPTRTEAAAGATLSVDEHGVIRAMPGAPRDSYTFEIPVDAPRQLAGLQIETLADSSLPGNGPGHAGGNFVISRVRASITPPPGSEIAGRYLRISIPGKQKILSLAEVQVYRGETNLALAGEADQSSTDFGGPARLATDGDTNGNYDAKTTTHTKVSSDPWWELDLKGEKAIDRVVIWNRTDNGLQHRLKDFQVTLLDGDRSVVWETKVAVAPDPDLALALSGPRPVQFASAFADHSQQDFEPAGVLNDDKDKGWAVGGSLGKDHALTLIVASPLSLEPGSSLTVAIDQQSKYDNHTIGKLRLSATADPRAETYARTPARILTLVGKPAADRTETEIAELAVYYRSIAPALEPQRQILAARTKERGEIQPYTTVPVMKELTGDQRRATRLHHRGNWLDQGELMEARLPTAFHPAPNAGPLTRLDLAHWLIDRKNPLTARVVVNRFWEALFGRGLVATSEEFGSQGELPTHPQLLDWLACELMDSGWDIKHLLKLMVTSAAYRQSSKASPDSIARDPDNQWLGRGPRFRLSAEMIRDQALAVAGLLSSKMFGPPAKPPQPSTGLTAAFGGNIDWKTSEGEDRYRRGLYTTWRRSNPYPSMATFDAPNREVCIVKRDRTNTPLQALVTLNDPVYVEAAQGLGRRMAARQTDIAGKLEHGFRLCLARRPSGEELEALMKLYQTARDRLGNAPADAKVLATDPIGPLPEGADPVDSAAWTVVANVLLNLDETLMKL